MHMLYLPSLCFPLPKLVKAVITFSGRGHTRGNTILFARFMLFASSK